MDQQMDVRRVLIHAVARSLVSSYDLRPEDVEATAQGLLHTREADWGIVSIAARAQHELCRAMQVAMVRQAQRAEASGEGDEAGVWRDAAEAAWTSWAAWYTLEQSLRGPDADPEFVTALRAAIAERAGTSTEVQG